MDPSSLGIAAARSLTLQQVQRTRNPRTVDGDFASMLADADVRGADPLGTAEDLVGTRLSPPPGGCSCDSLASSISPDGTLLGLVGPDISPRPVSQADVAPGDLLLLSAEGPQDSDRPHLAIARNAVQMIAPSAAGLVQVQPIPWQLVLGALGVGPERLGQYGDS